MRLALASETVLFDQTIPGGTDGLTLEHRLKFPGVIRRMTIEFYPGQEKGLRVLPYLMRAPDIYVPLSKFAGDRAYFSGDDSRYEIVMRQPFGIDDRICVDVWNPTTYDYNLYVLFEVDYGVMSS